MSSRFYFNNILLDLTASIFQLLFFFRQRSTFTLVFEIKDPFCRIDCIFEHFIPTFHGFKIKQYIKMQLYGNSQSVLNLKCKYPGTMILSIRWIFNAFMSLASTGLIGRRSNAIASFQSESCLGAAFS